jgi:GTP cyclohydrolase IB
LERDLKLETLQINSEKILKCEAKDQTGLNDYQKLPNQSIIPIDEVGIENFRIPLSFKHDDEVIMNHDCKASMFIYLDEGKTGANMSRFCKILQENALNTHVTSKFIENTLTRYRKELRDFQNEDLIPEAKLELNLSYPVKQKSLKSDNWGWQYYDLKLSGKQTKDYSTLEITIKYEYSSTCPCSLSMAKQYEKDFAEGKTTEGTGIAVAHSQRSIATISVTIDLDTDFQIIDLIDHAKEALPTETQSLVKRIDEQAFAILNGENPLFVEHATRRLSIVLDQDKRIIDWKAKVQHLESLHSHDAVATIKKRKPTKIH